MEIKFLYDTFITIFLYEAGEEKLTYLYKTNLNLRNQNNWFFYKMTYFALFKAFQYEDI